MMVTLATWQPTDSMCTVTQHPHHILRMCVCEVRGKEQEGEGGGGGERSGKEGEELKEWLKD